MKKLMFYLLALFILPVLSSCSIADAPPPEVSAATGNVISITVVSYTSATATVNIKGELLSDSLAPLSTIKLYSNSTCSGNSIGHGLASEFKNTGIQAQVSVLVRTSLYARTNLTSTCYFLTEYEFSSGNVPEPVFTRTDPVSPSFDSSAPFIYGSAVSGSVVTFYSDGVCSTPLASSTAETFNTSGLRLTLGVNQVNTIYADATDVFNVKSNCVHMTDYEHRLSFVSAPTFSQIIPSSPSNVTSSPVVRGLVPTGSAAVKLYSDTACNVKIGEGTPNNFFSPGIKVTVSPNVVTTIYAKSFDSSQNSSACTFLTNYLYDTIAPGPPSFINSVPVAPTRLTLYPKFYGSSPSDTARVKIFNNSDCTTPIGNGTKSEFDLTGLTAALTPNSITTIYAQALDAAGNPSACTYFLDYKHNTIPPDLPVLNSTDPISPNNISPNPLLNGNASVTTTQLHFYSDELCTGSIGSGTAEDFNNAGIRVYTPTVPNSVNITQIFVQAEDEEGNLSECSQIGSYGFSTAKAPVPSFSQFFPASPSRLSNQPVIFGSAPVSVSLVQLFGDPACTTLLGSANRAVFGTQGITANLPPNATTDIYATSVDVYGNSSDCVYFTTFTHDTIPPQAPTFLSTSPLSPNNTSSNPLIKGNVVTSIPGKPLATSKILFYDSLLCITQISVGVPSDYVSTGINVDVPANTVTSMYAVAADAAGNRSGCTFLTNYTYSTNPPGYPTLAAATPTPSYSKFFNLKGPLSDNIDIVSASTVTLYKDNTCNTVLATGSATQYTTTGINAVADVNSTTTVFGQTTDVVGTKSACRSLINFVHNQNGPTGLIAQMNIDGSVGINWQLDTQANPIPTYVVKRSKTSGGPYTVISSMTTSNYFRDLSVVNGDTYYYVVAATNSTGISRDSAEASITVVGPSAQAPLGLTGNPGDSVAYLSWTLNGADLNYKIYRSTQHGGPYTLIASNLTVSSYIDYGLTNDTAYYYVMAGVNTNGTSVQSAEISVMPIGAPEAPTNLELTVNPFDPNCSNNDGSATLTWTSPSYTSRFMVQRGPSAGSFGDRATVSGNSFTDCIQSQSYGNSTSTAYYRVVAIWGNGLSAVRSDPSNVVAMYPNGAPPAPVAKAGNNQVLVSWTSLVNVSTYQVWRSTKPGWKNENYTQLASNFAGTVYIDNTALNDQSYYYVVIANYSSGADAYPSLEVSAVPKPNPTSPGNLLLSIDSASNSIYLTWKISSYANNYNIYRSVNGGLYNPIGSSVMGTFNDTPASPGFYRYYVTTSWGSYESPPTNIVSTQYGVLPGTLTANPTASSINLSWLSAATAVSYNVLRSNTFSGPYVVIDNVTTTNYSNSTTNPASYPTAMNQPYFYKVQPVFAGNSPGQQSAAASAMLVGSPLNPQALTVTGTTANSVSLAWARVGSGPRTYFVYRSSSVSGTYTKLAGNANSPDYIATFLTSNSTHYFKVAASTCATACLSNAISAFTAEPPTAPAVKGGNNTVQVTGFGVGASSYEILRYTTDPASYTVVTSGLPSISYDDNTAMNGTNYYYRIRATYSDGSKLTSPDSVPVVPGITPQVPSNLIVKTNSSGDSITLAWATVGGASDYIIYYGNTAGGPYPSSLIASGNNATVTGLTPDIDYYFVLRARVGLIESGNSPELVARPTVAPAAPTLTATASAIGVSWTAVSGAASYQVQRSSDKQEYSTIVSATASLSYIDTGVVSGVSYYYRVYMFTAAGSSMGRMSTAGPIDIHTVTPPSMLTGSSSSATAISMSWVESPSNISGYNIYRSQTAGGPYTKIQTTGSTITSYVDTGLSTGQSYYYVVKAATSTGLESVATNEIAIKLSSGPSPLAISTGNGVLNLSWTAVGGASQYSLYRSTVSGGPYGKIADTSSLSYVDSTVQNGVTYYYVVTATFANGDISLESNEVTALATKTLSLRVPIELIDQGLASSDLSPLTFERSRTSLETTAYNGTVSYDFEIVATNAGGVSTNVDLLDQSDNVVAQVTIPAATMTPLRLSAAMTPVAGFHTYRIRLAQSASYADIQVYSAKLWVNQTNATKTKIFIPLLAANNSPVNGDIYAPLDSTNDGALTILNNAEEYVRDLSNLSHIPDYHGWELESVVSTYGSRGVIGLLNTTSGQIVDTSEVTFDDTDVTLFNSAFDEGVNEFKASNDLNTYKVAFRCYLDCELGPINVYKAGLWVKLENIASVEIPVRLGTVNNGVSALMQDDKFRTAIDLTQYSNPNAYFRTTARVGMGGDSSDIRLVSNGTGLSADSGSSSLSPVTNSSLNFTETTFTRKQTSTPLVVTPQHRLMTEVSPISGNIDVRSSYIVIRASP